MGPLLPCRASSALSDTSRWMSLPVACSSAALPCQGDSGLLVWGADWCQPPTWLQPPHPAQPRTSPKGGRTHSHCASPPPAGLGQHRTLMMAKSLSAQPALDTT